MLRKIFSTVILLTAFLVGSVSSAAESVELTNVAVIVEPPVETFTRSEKVYDSIQQTINKIFKNTSSYNVASIDETSGYVQVYREDNEIDAETFLKKSDIDKIAKHEGSDFIIYLRIAGNEPKTLSETIIRTPAKVVLDFRIWSDSTQDFTYTKRITKNDDYTLEKSLSKALQEVEKDAGKIRAAM